MPLWGALAGAQTAQPKIPVRDLAPSAARSAQTIGQIASVRQLANGRVLVSDTRAEQLLVFDSTLRTFAVLADTGPSTAIRYPRGSATLIPYIGDSTLFVDIPSRALIVINPDGTAGRSVALPKMNDLPHLTRFTTGTGVDAMGRLIYRGVERPSPTAPPSAEVRGGSAQPDSAPTVRGDFEKRVVDTIARIKVAHEGFASGVRDPTTGNAVMTEMLNPVLAPFDEWAVTSDGVVALVRAHDYHVDWILADGTQTSTAKMAYDLRRLTDNDKQRKLDSARKIIDSARAAGAYKSQICNGATRVCRTVERNVQLVPLADVPDYVPPFRAGAVRADRDGNIWILPTTSAQSNAGELVYDVINRTAGLFERVRVPKGKSIVGFGRGGVVYLASGDAKNGYHLEQTRVTPIR